MRITFPGNLRQMSNDDDLHGRGHALENSSDFSCNIPGHPTIDLIKNDRWQ